MRNIVLISLDSVRKDYFDRYAFRLQDQASVSFAECRAASSWSVPSHGSMLTGELPSNHGAHAHHIDFSHLSFDEVFLSDLPDHTSIAVSANTYASPQFGFDLFFDDLVTISQTCRWPQGLDPIEMEGNGISQYLNFVKACVMHDQTFKSVANGIIGQLQSLTANKYSIPKLFDDGVTAIAREALQQINATEQPYFLFLDVMDTHLPFQPTRGYDSDLYSAPASWSTSQVDQWEVFYEPTEEYITRLRELYGASIDYVDRKLNQFITTVLKTDPNTTIIITADHGDNLGYPEENGLFRHRSSLSEGLLHVPLYIINPPDGYQHIEHRYFSHLALGELIIGMAHGQTPNVFREKLAAELIGLSSCPKPPADHEYWNRMIRCVYTDEHKIEWDKIEWDSLGNKTVYELDSTQACWQSPIDTDVAVADLENAWFDEPIKEAKERARTEETTVEMDHTTKSQLEDLGYL